MIVTGTYQDGLKHEIIDYTIENGTNLTKEQTSVTINYEEKTTTQDITVVEKTITGISINKKPTKLKYIQNKENLDLTGGDIIVSYNDGTTENIKMNSNQITATGFDNKNLGKITITLTYQSKTVEFEVEIIEEIKEKAENSNLENAKCDVKKIKAYYFTDNSQDNYILINIEINNIERNFNNDKVEYYYYLSTVKDEENITDWTKITEEQNNNDKLQFTIDSKNIKNYEDVSKENILYLYIKEVATKGGNQSVAVSKPLLIEPNGEIEIYVNNIKNNNINSGDSSMNNDLKDNTVSNIRLPKTGTKTFIFIILIVITIGGFCFYRYYRLKDVK